MLQDQPPRPANMANIVAINQGLKSYATREPVIPPVGLVEAQRMIRNGILILDTRRHDAFGRAHIPGAYNVEVCSASFEQNVGWLVPPDDPFVLVVDRPESASSAAHKLAFVGLDQRVVGAVSMEDWLADGLPEVELPQIDVQDLHAEMQSRTVRVLDVRDNAEWGSGHIESAINMNFKYIPTDLERLEFAPEQELAVICAGGMRSSTACSVLRRHGYHRVYNVKGGMNAWDGAGLPVHRPEITS